MILPCAQLHQNKRSKFLPKLHQQMTSVCLRSKRDKAAKCGERQSFLGTTKTCQSFGYPVMLKNDKNVVGENRPRSTSHQVVILFYSRFNSVPCLPYSHYKTCSLFICPLPPWHLRYTLLSFRRCVSILLIASMFPLPESFSIPPEMHGGTQGNHARREETRKYVLY